MESLSCSVWCFNMWLQYLANRCVHLPNEHILFVSVSCYKRLYEDYINPELKIEPLINKPALMKILLLCVCTVITGKPVGVNRREWAHRLMAGDFWEVTFAFYTRVKTVHTAGPCYHANRAFLLLLLSLASTLASNQEVAHRRKRGIFTYPWLYPRLTDSSLLLATAGPLKWTVFRMEGGTGGMRQRVSDQNEPACWEPFPVQQMTFLTRMKPGNWYWIWNPSASNEDNVSVWPYHCTLHSMPSTHVHPHHPCHIKHIIKREYVWFRTWKNNTMCCFPNAITKENFQAAGGDSWHT